jgi:hypothetical protein
MSRHNSRLVTRTCYQAGWRHSELVQGTRHHKAWAILGTLSFAPIRAFSRVLNHWLVGVRRTGPRAIATLAGWANGTQTIRHPGRPHPRFDPYAFAPRAGAVRKSDLLRMVSRLQIPTDREVGGDSTPVADMSAAIRRSTMTAPASSVGRLVVTTAPAHCGSPFSLDSSGASLER